MNKSELAVRIALIYSTKPYKPKEHATKVTCPTLVVLAEKDNVNPPEHGIELYNALRSRTKQLYIEPDAHHYDIYRGSNNEKLKYGGDQGP